MAYEAKTKVTDENVRGFIESVPDERKRADALLLVDLFERMTGDTAQMWGPSIIGFGRYHYKYDSGHEGDAPRAGFSPRKANIALYLTSGYEDAAVASQMADLRERLGKYRTAKSCLYINRLSDIDMEILGEIIRLNGLYMDERYPR